MSSHPEITFLKLFKIVCLLFSTHCRLSFAIAPKVIRALFLANCLWLMEYRVQFLPNFTVFTCDAPVSFSNLIKEFVQLLVLLQQVIGHQKKCPKTYWPMRGKETWNKYTPQKLHNLALTARQEYTSCVIKSLENLKNIKTVRVPYLSLELTMYVLKSQIHLVRQSL